MADLIKALQIFAKYTNTKYPTHCSQDQLSIMDVNLKKVSEEDVKSLDELGFFWCTDDDCFISFKYGRV